MNIDYYNKLEVELINKEMDKHYFDYLHDLFLFDNLIEDKNSECVVMFSGGYDSTLNILLLCELKKNGIIENRIGTVTVEGFENEDKIKAESKARENILKLISEKYQFSDSEFHDYGAVSQINLNVNSKYKQGFFLQELFISNVIPFLPNKTNLITGFCKDDSSTILFNNLQKICDGIDQYCFDSKTKILAPLNSFSKKDIVKILLTNYKEFFDLSWTCQNPVIKNNKIKPCYRCVKCKEVSNALQALINKDINTEKKFNSLKNKVIESLSEK